MVAFVAYAFWRIWELRNKILYEVIIVNVNTLDWLCWQVENDLLEEAHKAKTRERGQVEFLGNGSSRPHINCLGLN